MVEVELVEITSGLRSGCWLAEVEESAQFSAHRQGKIPDLDGIGILQCRGVGAGHHDISTIEAAFLPCGGVNSHPIRLKLTSKAERAELHQWIGPESCAQAEIEDTSSPRYKPTGLMAILLVGISTAGSPSSTSGGGRYLHLFQLAGGHNCNLETFPLVTRHSQRHFLPSCKRLVAEQLLGGRGCHAGQSQLSSRPSHPHPLA